MLPKQYVRIVSVIILVLCLLQPLACFSHPCATCLDKSDKSDTSETHETHTHNQDADNCDLTVCCAEYLNYSNKYLVAYKPFISVTVTIEQSHELSKVVFPIYVPPQNLV